MALISTRNTAVNADQWSDMTLDELIQQKSVMLDRLSFAIHRKDTRLTTTIQEGVDRIEAIILSKC